MIVEMLPLRKERHSKWVETGCGRGLSHGMTVGVTPISLPKVNAGTDVPVIDAAGSERVGTTLKVESFAGNLWARDQDRTATMPL